MNQVHANSHSDNSIKFAASLNTGLVNVNISGTQIPYNSSFSEDNSQGLFIPNALGIEVRFAGFIETWSSIYVTTAASASERGNVATSITVNGVPTPIIGADAYIRSVSGHNETTSQVRDVIQVSVGDVIGVEATALGNAGVIELIDGRGKLTVKRLS